MSQFHLFQPPTSFPFISSTFPSTNMSQLPLQVQFQLAAWNALHIRQQERTLPGLNVSRAQEKALKEAKIEVVLDDDDVQDERKASPNAENSTGTTPLNGIHKPEPISGDFLFGSLFPAKNSTDFRFVESLIVREPFSQRNNQLSFPRLPVVVTSPQNSKEKKKRQEKETTSNSPPLVARACPICQKKFTRHWLLQGHIRTHTGERPFKCQVCSKAFADKSNLRAHVQTHSGVKNHVCQRCGKRFALKSYLSKHEESSCQIRHSHLHRPLLLGTPQRF